VLCPCTDRHCPLRTAAARHLDESIAGRVPAEAQGDAEAERVLRGMHDIMDRRTSCRPLRNSTVAAVAMLTAMAVMAGGLSLPARLGIGLRGVAENKAVRSTLTYGATCLFDRAAFDGHQVSHHIV